MTDLTALYREDATEQEVLEAFQVLINSGDAWRFEGHVGRTAMSLIEAGLCMLGPTVQRDYWGNHVLSRFQVVPGRPGSPEYVEARRRTN